MGQYEVLRDIIKGARPGQTVNLTTDEAKAYGDKYVKLIGKVVDVDVVEKITTTKKVITKAKNKGL